MTTAEQLVEELGRLYRTLSRVDEEPYLTSTQRLALAALAGGESLRLMELAQRVGATDPTASRAVDGLVGHGLVERRDDPDDRRALRLVVTVKGRKRVERSRREAARILQKGLDELPPAGRARLVDLLRRLNASLLE